MVVSHFPFILSGRFCEDLTYKNCLDMLGTTIFVGVGSIISTVTKQTINSIKW